MLNRLPQTTPCTCPTCGGYMGEAAPLEAVREALTGRERRVFDALEEAGAGGITTVDLSIKLFGSECGCSERKMHYTTELISFLRKRLEPFGYCVPRNKALNRGKYRIIPMEAGQ